ncbi:hypothetical protein P168DRAFT_317098 [Aspergillus campestris IBT 28561]|uniref:Uncharacterized protein n=1 Tax=Aspergillus campestris (strain IBT 28561) TaxID=1392248 RepID=A0A2I1D6R7_ASPC2|nr:uncharacterized protein P168DRAFT_317098 [Aspergillus campestris IBT 28561]PKY05576.1 hypothetical protein P168DRAFT_317098 [Aspergillus campestris IBT 28561]
MSPSLPSIQEAEANLQTRPAQPPRDEVSGSGLMLYPRSAVGWNSAEDGSIHSILRDNCRKRLYVKPIAWTSDHLQLLRCRFNYRPARSWPKEERSKRQPLEPSHAQKNVEQQAERRTHESQRLRYANNLKVLLAYPSLLGGKQSAIEEILEAYDIHPQRLDFLSFDFNRRHAAHLATDGIFSSSAAPSSVAFITFDTIQSLRTNHVQPHKSKSVPVLRQRRKRLQLLGPPNPTEDPYVIAVLIALAQNQRREQQEHKQQKEKGMEQGAPGAARSFKVHVLAVTCASAMYLYVYTANIPVEFLDKFDEPYM